MQNLYQQRWATHNSCDPRAAKPQVQKTRGVREMPPLSAPVDHLSATARKAVRHNWVTDTPSESWEAEIHCHPSGWKRRVAFEGDNEEALEKPPCETRVYDLDSNAADGEAEAEAVLARASNANQWAKMKAGTNRRSSSQPLAAADPALR